MARAWPQRRVDRAREAWDDVPTAGPADLGGGAGHRGLAIEAHARERSPICVMRRRAPRHYNLPREAGSVSSSPPPRTSGPASSFGSSQTPHLSKRRPMRLLGGGPSKGALEKLRGSQKVPGALRGTLHTDANPNEGGKSW